MYRKPTHTDHLVKFDSNHATSAKTAVDYLHMNCFDKHFAKDDDDGKEPEHYHITDVLYANGRPERFVQYMMHTKESNSDERSCVSRVSRASIDG